MKASNSDNLVTRRRFVAESSLLAMLLVSPLAFLSRQVLANAAWKQSVPKANQRLRPSAPGFSFPAPSDVALYLKSGDRP